ncbi:MAG: TM7S3/TM198-like domain-containing protein [Planctomycetota bacterium]|jgi:hypothetical protein
MDCLAILAQAGETAAETPQAKEAIDKILEQITSLGLIEALTFISFGVVCLFYGWRVFKILVVISFTLFGLFLGVYANHKLVGGDSFWLGIISMILFAVLSVPLMRWGVSILGAAAGGILTGGAWYAFRLPEQYVWAGAIAGMIAGGMISFIIFKIAIMLFSSLGGSALVVVGVLAVIHDYMPTSVDIEDLIRNHKWFLPVAILVPMAIGIYWQNRFIKGSQDWSV